MTKTPEQMAEEYADTKHNYNPNFPRDVQHNYDVWWDSKEDFLAGYNRCSNDNSYLTVTQQSREVLRVTPTETGFDVVIPDGITMTEAAQIFVNAVKDIIKQGNHEQNT